MPCATMPRVIQAHCHFELFGCLHSPSQGVHRVFDSPFQASHDVQECEMTHMQVELEFWVVKPEWVCDPLHHGRVAVVLPQVDALRSPCKHHLAGLIRLTQVMVVVGEQFCGCSHCHCIKHDLVTSPPALARPAQSIAKESIENDEEGNSDVLVRVWQRHGWSSSRMDGKFLVCWSCVSRSWCFFPSVVQSATRFRNGISNV